MGESRYKHNPKKRKKHRSSLHGWVIAGFAHLHRYVIDMGYMDEGYLNSTSKRKRWVKGHRCIEIRSGVIGDSWNVYIVAKGEGAEEDLKKMQVLCRLNGDKFPEIDSK